MIPDDSTRERLLIFITSLGHFLCHLGELVFLGCMFAVKKEMDLDPLAVTTLPMLGFVLMGVGALPVGVIADRWGTARVFQFYFVMMAFSALLVVASPTPLCLFLALTFLGLALSIYHPVGLAMLSTGVRHRGKAMGINGVAGSIGVAVGPLLGAAAAAMGQWRLAFVVLAGMCSLAAVYMFVIQRRLGDLDAAPHSTAPHPVVITEPSRSFIRRNLPMILLSASMLLGGFNYRCLVTALPEYFNHSGAARESLFKGGVVVFLVLLIGGCIGQYLGGWSFDRFGSWVYPFFIAMLAPCGLFLAVSQGTMAGGFVAALLAMNLFAQQPVENAILAHWTPRGRRGLSYGTKIALTFGFGAFGSLVTGMIWEAHGTSAPVFFLFAGTSLCMVVLVTSALNAHRTAVRAEHNRIAEMQPSTVRA